MLKGAATDPAGRADQRPRRRDALVAGKRALETFPGCAVVISHDRWFLDRTCTHILAWEGNVEEGNWFWFEGNFEAYEGEQDRAPGRGRPSAPRDAPQAHRD